DAKHYKAVRAAFSASFERKHADTIKAAFGDKHAELTAWLDKRPDVKQELFTAIDEAHDDVAAALRLFAELWKAWPDKVEAFPSLAIATAVVWDRPNFGRAGMGGVYDYKHHQVRTKSTLPEGQVDGKGNFEYLVNAPPAIIATHKTLPREFLMFV